MSWQPQVAVTLFSLLASPVLAGGLAPVAMHSDCGCNPAPSCAAPVSHCGGPVCGTPACGCNAGGCGLPMAMGMGEMPPGPVDRDLLLPLSPNEARLILNVPASAIVYFGKQRMNTRGEERVYRIPLTQAGTVFRYPVRILVPGQIDILTSADPVALKGGEVTELLVGVVAEEVGGIAIEKLIVAPVEAAPEEADAA